jgi:serine/threonine protein kinase
LQIIAREIKVHSKLDHPHIIKLWDTIFYDNKIYMVMDYAKNGSLFKYHSNLLQSGTQPPLSQVYQFFYQTLQALKYLHSNDIMHRDIKVSHK